MKSKIIESVSLSPIKEKKKKENQEKTTRSLQTFVNSRQYRPTLAKFQSSNVSPPTIPKSKLIKIPESHREQPSNPSSSPNSQTSSPRLIPWKTFTLVSGKMSRVRLDRERCVVTFRTPATHTYPHDTC